jgi:hypothetical protein
MDLITSQEADQAKKEFEMKKPTEEFTQDGVSDGAPPSPVKVADVEVEVDESESLLKKESPKSVD